MTGVRCVGLDISSTSTGVAMADGRLVTIAPKAKLIPHRLDELVTGVLQALRAGGGADVAVIEAYNPGGLQGFTMARLGEAGGIVRWALWRQEVVLAEVTPKTLKKFATGSGAADKEKVYDAAVAAGAGRCEPRNFDESDAYWLRQAALHQYDPFHDHAVDRDDTQRGALDVVRWPPLPDRLTAVGGRTP